MTFTFRHGERPLDGYTILRGLGRGGFGEVYYAVSDGGREVALKAIQQNHDVELRGVRHCMNLKSPHLISIFDLKRTEGGMPFVIMEYVAGPSLRDILRRFPEGLGAARAAWLTREIGRGLDYLHERGIVHRDLKPENIFWEDGYVKIGDYGLSKYISVSRQSGQTISVGTVHYMAPEIGSGNYHRGIDIYALGIILYELSSGRVPYNGDSMGEIIMKHLTAEPDLAGIDPRFHAVIRRALAKRPEDRYARVDEMLADLVADPAFAAAVDAVPSDTFASIAPPEVPTLEAVPTLDAPSPAPARLGAPAPPAPPPPPAAVAAVAPAPPPPPPPLAAPRAEPAAAPPPREEILSGEPLRFFGHGFERRLPQTLATAAGMALALSFTLDGPRLPTILGCLTTIIAGGLGLCFVEHWAAPRFRIDFGLARRFLTLGVVGPAIAVALALFSDLPTVARSNTVAALFLGIAIVNWPERARARRPEPASLGQAFYAALGGVLLSLLFRAHAPSLFIGGLLASLSLVLNAASPFAAKARSAARDRRSPSAPPAAPEPPFLEVVGGAPRPGGAAPAPIDPALDPALEPVNSLYRPNDGRMVAGVCMGLSVRYGWEPTWIRLAFLAGALATFGGFLVLYLFLAVSMPSTRRGIVGVDPRSGVGPGRDERRKRPLARPERERVVGGVCAGISAHYGIEVVWVRMAAVIFFIATVAYGLALYIALWIIMPAGAASGRSPGTAAVAAVAAGARATRAALTGTPKGSLCRSLWYIVAAAALAFSLGFSIYALRSYAGRANPGWQGFDRIDDDVVVPLGIGMAFLALSSFAFIKARLPRGLGFWAGSICPFLLMAALATAGTSFSILSLYRMRMDETAIAIAFLAGGGMAALFFGAVLLRGLRRVRPAPPPPDAAAVLARRAGWKMLGALLIVGALALTVLGTFLGMGLGEELSRELALPAHWTAASRRGDHFVIALAAYALGVIAVLFGRRGAGAAHVVRAFLGFAILGVVVGFLAAAIHWDGFYEPGTDVAAILDHIGSRFSWDAILTLALALAAGIAFLAWPRRSLLTGSEPLSEEHR